MNGFRSIYASDLSHRAKSVYMYLKDRADSEGRCWPAIKTIALELGFPVLLLSERWMISLELDCFEKILVGEKMAATLLTCTRLPKCVTEKSNAKKQTLPARGRVCFLGEPRIGS